MPLSEKFSELAAYIDSPKYLLAARHPDHPTAFTRSRKLPLASLVAVLLLCCCAACVLIATRAPRNLSELRTLTGLFKIFWNKRK